MSQNFFLPFLLFTLLPIQPALSVLPDPDPVPIQQYLPVTSPPATIPAFPEQSEVAGCPLDLPDDLFHGVKSACGSRSGHHLHRTRCCPVLAAWLYSAYAETALGSSTSNNKGNLLTASYDDNNNDMPLLPDDSETCVDGLEKALLEKGIELAKPNETCDVVFCYCGIRLHPLSCPEAFSVNSKGKLMGDQNVERLERDCLGNSGGNGYVGLDGCSKCLNTLYLLNEEKRGNSSKKDDRTSKMHNRDCELMGLTWLLAKNRTTYMHTVSSVLRAIMMNKDLSDPQSCTLNSDGMPLAVDSSEINDQSSSITLRLSLPLCILLCLLYLTLIVSSLNY